MISDKNFLLCVNDRITCCEQSEKALVKAKIDFDNLRQKNLTEFCIISLLAKEEKQDNKFLIK